MASVDDWATKAARTIMLQYDLKQIAPSDTSVYRIRGIIDEHCPFKNDVAYMPVPRCATCEHWSEYEEREGKGDCSMVLNFAKRNPALAVGELETRGDFGCVEWKGK